MPDVKLCPMAFNSPEHRDCIQEKCSWWVVPTDMIEGQTVNWPGHCVALDWRKP